MTYQVRYVQYSNIQQFPEATQEKLDSMIADGWRIHTADPGGGDLSILWERGTLDEPEPTPASKHRAPQHHRENPRA